MTMITWIGWLATAVFALSYFCKRRATLMQVQALAACLWITYGLALGVVPVVVANAIVATMAVVSAHRGRRESSAAA